MYLTALLPYAVAVVVPAALISLAVAIRNRRRNGPVFGIDVLMDEIGAYLAGREQERLEQVPSPELERALREVAPEVAHEDVSLDELLRDKGEAA